MSPRSRPALKRSLQVLVLAVSTALLGAAIGVGPALGAGLRSGDRDDWMRRAPTAVARPAQHAQPSAPPALLAAQALPEAALANWTRTTSRTPLWSGSEADAVQFNVAPAGTTLKTMGVPQGGRLPVYFAGDGSSRQPGAAWVDLAALEPAQTPAWLATSEVPESGASQVRGGPTRAALVAPPAVSARTIAVVDGATGQLLYGQRSRDRVAIASTTKIATTLVALQRGGDLQRSFRVSVSGSAMAARDGSSIMGLEPGETVTLATLLYGLMLPSGNDAAEQVALSLAGSRAAYAGWMNELATSLGLSDTHFVSVSGMDAAGHYSSAYDMALLSRAAMADARFREIASAPRYRGDGYSLTNINRLLGNYPGADGVKTGFTDDAGRTMIASATRNGHRVFVSVMRSDNLVADTTALLDWSWRAFRWD